MYRSAKRAIITEGRALGEKTKERERDRGRKRKREKREETRQVAN